MMTQIKMKQETLSQIILSRYKEFERYEFRNMKQFSEETIDRFATRNQGTVNLQTKKEKLINGLNSPEMTDSMRN